MQQNCLYQPQFEVVFTVFECMFRLLTWGHPQQERNGENSDQKYDVSVDQAGPVSRSGQERERAKQLEKKFFF